MEALLVAFPSNLSTRQGGDNGREVIVCPVRPLWYITRPLMLPKHNKQGSRVRTVFSGDWKPVLLEMQKGLGHSIANVRVEDVDSAFLEATYNEARLHLEQKYPALFAGEDSDANRLWRVSTWSKNMRAEDRRIRRELSSC